jgi:CelD/BcsL family acetyltransferase involved in cellulose biosynthesis
MSAQVIDSIEKFRKLDAHWERLASSGGVRTPYQSFSWLEQWLQHRGARMQPMILALQDGATIAPLGLVRTGLMREVGMLGTPDADYVGLVTTRPLDEAWDAVACALAERRRSFDLVHVQSSRDREAIVSALQRRLHGQGFERVYERCPWISTDQSWEQLRSTRRNGLRSEIRRWERRLREIGPVLVERVGPPLAPALLDELEGVEMASWKWEQGDSALRPGPQREFLWALLRDPRADVSIWLLRIAGRLSAYAIVLVGGDRWYYYLPSFRKDAPNAGALLLSHIVEEACGANCRAVDLLRGDHGYKRAWSDRVDDVFEIVWPTSVIGRVSALVYSARWRAARSERLRALRARILRVGDRRRGPGEAS